MILSNAHRFARIPERIFNDHLIPPLAKDDADCWLIVRVADQVIDGGKIELHLACKLRLEVFDLQLNDHETPQAEVVEKKIQIVILPAYLKMILASDKGEPFAELEDQVSKVF